MTEAESRPIEGFESLPGAPGSYRDAAKLLARYSLTWPLHIKLTLNAWLGRDMCQLNSRERQQIKMMPAFNRVLRISPRSFRFRMTGRRRHNVVTFNCDHLDRIPLVEFDTFVFVDEIVRQGLPYERTVLYKKVVSGKLRKLMRPLKTAEDPRKWSSIQSEAGFKRYYDRCMRLAESIADHGIFDMSTDGRHAQALRFGHDQNILVAIDEHGELIHWRRGKHRLAISLALGLTDIPVKVALLSGHWMQAVAGSSRPLGPGGLANALTLALKEAETRACT
ncbi:MAG TPA: hypothetical protein VK451_10230 [Methyloceanibacter sp.]|nr:hypothetical protein [Methyloceanibacter sp.]